MKSALARVLALSLLSVAVAGAAAQDIRTTWAYHAAEGASPAAEIVDRISYLVCHRPDENLHISLESLFQQIYLIKQLIKPTKPFWMG